jgi:CheY-like chemotaxis protein
MSKLITSDGPHGRRSALVYAENALVAPVSTCLEADGHNVVVAPAESAEELLAVLFPVTRAAPCSEPAETSFFHWPLYDTIVLQDLWPRQTTQQLIALGCLLASADYYLQGNFAGQKIVLMTDPGYFETNTIQWERVLRLQYDTNGQIDFIPLVGVPPSTIYERLRIAAGAEQSVMVRPRTIEDRDVPDHGFETRHVIAEHLAAYVSARADVAVVDDDENTIAALAPSFGCPMKAAEHNALQLLRVLSGNASIVSHHAREHLVRDCLDIIRKPGDDRMTLFVTDLLFDRVDWRATMVRRWNGIELIDMLRTHAAGEKARVAIIALTGISAPAVVTAALQRGADAVVMKTTRHPGEIAHARHVDDEVIFRLLLTLAFLCFQREYLRTRRMLEEHPLRAQRALARVLPAHAVSPHVHEEREDTAYVLDARALYGDRLSKEGRTAIHDVLRRYGELR